MITTKLNFAGNICTENISLKDICFKEIFETMLDMVTSNLESSHIEWQVQFFYFVIWCSTSG